MASSAAGKRFSKHRARIAAKKLWQPAHGPVRNTDRNGTTENAQPLTGIRVAAPLGLFGFDSPHRSAPGAIVF